MVVIFNFPTTTDKIDFSKMLLFLSVPDEKILFSDGKIFKE